MHGMYETFLCMKYDGILKPGFSNFTHFQRMSKVWLKKYINLKCSVFFSAYFKADFLNAICFAGTKFMKQNCAKKYEQILKDT